MNLKDIANAAKHLVVDEVPDAPSTKVAPKAPLVALAPTSFPPANAPTVYYATPPEGTPTGGNDDAYQRLISKINFDSTQAGVVVAKYLKLFESVPDTVMPPSTKQVSALLQAKGEIGADKILSAYDDLKAQLQSECQKFATYAQAFEAKEITARTQRLTDIQTQISQLQAEMSQVATDLAGAQGKAAQTGGAFTVAAQRLDNEIGQQKAATAAKLQ